MSEPQKTNSETTTTPTNSPNRTPRPAFPQKTSWSSGRTNPNPNPNQNKPMWGPGKVGWGPTSATRPNTDAELINKKHAPAPQKENTTPSLKLNWTKEEDNTLADCIEIYGINDWNKISANIKGTTPRQCRERYEFYLKPIINTGPFTLEEDLQLIKLVQKIGNKWSKIKEHFENRSTIKLKNRFQEISSYYKFNKPLAILQADLIMDSYNKKNQPQEENLVQTTKDFTSIGVQTMEIPDVKVYSLFVDLLAEFDTKFNKIMGITRNE